MMMARATWLGVIVLAMACSAPPGGDEMVGTTAAALDAVPAFGSNPGNLLMFRYVPAGVPAKAPLVVVLHGCTQAAADIAAAGWNTLADRYKFYVVYPQQQSANNSEECFNWFGGFNAPQDKTNVTRGQGEDLSIKQMVDRTMADYSVDPSRVFVAGFSAGAAMTAVLLATWPDVFAAGGIDAGVPYGCPATSNTDVFMCMNPGKTQTADQWAQAVKAGDPGYAGPWPRVSIWQGTSDYTVATANEGELVKQWTDVHGLSATPTASDTVETYPHDVFADSSGRVVVEEYKITGMSHGMAIDAAGGCGTASQYLPDMHICTAAHMLEFFGIAAAGPTADAGQGAPAPGAVGGGGGSGGAGGAGGKGGDASAPQAASTGCTQGAAPSASANVKGSAGCALSKRGPDGTCALGALLAVAAICRRRRRGRRAEAHAPRSARFRTGASSAG